MKRLAAAPLIVAGVALLAGCSGSGGDKPTALPSLTSKPAASASPAPVPPAATAKTPEGAAAFARFYFDQLNVAFSTSDASIIRTFSQPTCGTCELYAQGLADSRTRGLRIVGTAFLVNDVEAAPVQSGRVSAEVFGSVPAQQQVDSSGRTIHSLSSQGKFHFTVTLRSLSVGWSVDDIRIDAN